MAPRDDQIPEIPEEPPVETDLYEILGIKEDATPDQVKTAYKKLALKYHPDKAPPDGKEEANQQFQKIAFAYAILSDERRRQRFDLSGSTAEAVDLDDDFDWVDFYREQFSTAIDTNAIEKLKEEYQGSESEKGDVLAAFQTYRGDLDRVYESVMLCNVLDDDDRIRAIIDQAIAEGRVDGYKKYTEEPAKKREQRLKRAQKEAKEAEKLAKKLEKGANNTGVGGKRKGKGSTSSSRTTTDNNDLAALIQQRQASRAESFFDRLEAKYSSGASGKKRVAAIDEPPEEAFEATAARRVSKKAKSKAKTKA